MNQTRRNMMGITAAFAASGWTQQVSAAQTPKLAEHPLVARIWHGRTPADKADEYRLYLYEAGVKKIATQPGNRGVQMMVSKTVDQGEFMVVSYWHSIDAIRGYTGDDYTKVHDLPRDSEFLIDKETLVRHFSLDVDRSPPCLSSAGLWNLPAL